ncbi:MAG: hypothetical protein U0166_15845 [Acidobacteriota bacterium]
MDDETKRILSMIETGKITAEQGAELLRALGKSPAAAKPEAAPARETGEPPKVIGIFVTEGDKERVRVKIPFGLVTCVEKFVPKAVVAKMHADGTTIDLAELLTNIKSCTGGDVLTVDTDDGKKVRIACE